MSTFAENNEEQNAKWTEFKKRNMLRKLDLALNRVLDTHDDIVCASNAELQKMAEKAQGREQLPRNEKKYIIDIPSPDEEFPHLATTKANIYPLPVSHENQCSTVGLAGNLDKFTEEFKFLSQSQTNSKCIPVRKSGKSFAIEKAYEPFAFMKSLERHKEQQSNYERILRRTLDSNYSEETDRVNEIVVAIDDDVSSESDYD